MKSERTLLLTRIGITTIAVVALAGALTMLFALLTAQMGTMFFALIAGVIGAEVSIIRRMPRLKDADVKALISSWWSLLVPLMAGGLMAGFLYMSFMAGILTGDGGGGLFTSNPSLHQSPNECDTERTSACVMSRNCWVVVHSEFGMSESSSVWEGQFSRRADSSRLQMTG